MEAFERPHGKTLRARLEEDPRWIIVINGPRQTGKTTLVSQVLRQIQRRSAHIAVDRPDPTTVPITTGLRHGVTSLTTGMSPPPIDRRNTRWLVRKWKEARLEAKASDQGFVLALDEIQKIPDWSETVKGLWDADRLAERGRARVPRANLELQAACRAEGPFTGSPPSIAGALRECRLSSRRRLPAIKYPSAQRRHA